MTIFSSALKRIFKSKVRFVILILCPFICISAFTFQNHRAATVGVVDYDNTVASKGIYDILNKIEGIKLEKVSEDRMYDMTASYVLDYSIVIDKGFENKLLSGEEANLGEYYIEDREKTYFIKNSLSQELDNYRILAQASHSDKAKFESALKKYRQPGLEVQSNLEQNNRIFKARAAVGFLVQFMMYMGVITTGLILEDKANGTYYRVFSGPVSIKRYMSENFLAFFITAVIQSLSIILASRLLFGMYLGSSPVAFLLLFVVFSLVCISIGMLVTSLCKKPIQAYVAITVLTTPIIMLGGCYWEFSIMPDLMNRVGRFVPMSWLMRAVDSILNGSFTTNSLLLNFGILLLFAAVFFTAGIVKKVDISD